MTEQQFLILIRRKADEAGSQKDLARQLKVSEQYISAVMAGRQRPGNSILKPLGLRRVVSYETLKEQA